MSHEEVLTGTTMLLPVSHSKHPKLCRTSMSMCSRNFKKWRGGINNPIPNGQHKRNNRRESFTKRLTSALTIKTKNGK